VTGLALAALFLDPAPPPVEKGDTFLTAETTGILDIEVGECFDDPTYSRMADDHVVVYRPCADGADNQSFGFVAVPDGPWDRAAVAAFGWAECERRFARLYPGPAADGLDYYPVLPTAQTWADGDRTIMCAVYRPAGPLAGSTLPLAGR